MLANPRAVLIKGHIPHPMDLVFDRPMIAVVLKQPCRAGFLWGKAGDTIDALRMEFFPRQIGCMAMDAENLCEIGEIGVVHQFGAGPNATGLDAAMSFGHISVLRGENRQDAGLRCPGGEWLDYP